MPSPVIHATCPAELAEWVSRREELRLESRSMSRAAVSELWRLRALLDAELARTRWSLDELELLARSTMGTPPGPGAASSPGAMFAAVYDSRRLGEIPDDEATAALLDKLGQLGPTADMALEYAVAAWWDGRREHTALEWEAVGVRVAVD